METAPKNWALFWTATGQYLGSVKANTVCGAVRKVRKEYRNMIGEIFAMEIVEVEDCTKGEK